ncbi:hypothetical protein LINPERHAP1_LOCUS30048 [Linum perenne]
MGTKGTASAKLQWKLRKDSQLTDEFSYEDDDVRCFCELRASRRISRTEANPIESFLDARCTILRMFPMFICLDFSFVQDVKGCDFFLWHDMKIQEDVRKLTSLVENLSVHLRDVQREKNELESTLDHVMKHSHDVPSSTYSAPVPQEYIVRELEMIKNRLSRVEDAVFARR